jgi:hypothetical protein
MKKILLATFLFASMLSFGCGNSNNTVNKTDTLSGNTDSMGSQPVQPGPGAANGGNATDTVANRNGDLKPRTDSVIRH